MREVEIYQLEVAGLTSLDSSGSGTSLIEWGWILFYAGVVPGERQRARVGLLIAPQLSANVLEFTLVDERLASCTLTSRAWLHLGLY